MALREVERSDPGDPHAAPGENGSQFRRVICVRAFPRVHVGLLDLGDVTPRRNGGAGFALAGPTLEISAEAADALHVDGLHQLDERAGREVREALSGFEEVTGPLGARLTIERALPAHVGLGSKTALLLAILQAASSIARRPLDMATLQRLSGRGGTSGVGINTFFRGGFVTDGGGPAAPGRPHGPSSASRPDRVPPVLCRLDIPADWRFTLLVHPSHRIADEAERQLFVESTPVPEREVLRSIAVMYHGIAAAVATADLGLLGTALAELHCLGFKGRELAAQPRSIRDLYERVRELPGSAVGLSSVGPLLYVISSAADPGVANASQSMARDCGFSCLGTFEPRNAGFELVAGSC